MFIKIYIFRFVTFATQFDIEFKLVTVELTYSETVTISSHMNKFCSVSHVISVIYTYTWLNHKIS